MKKNTYTRSVIFCLIITITLYCGKEEKEKSGFANEKSTPVKSGKDLYSFNEGMKLAKKHDKLAVIDFYADWCTYCKKMEKETYSDSKVSKKLKTDFIKIRIDTTNPEYGKINYKNKLYTVREFSGLLGIQGLPTIIFLDKDENFITKVAGYIEKDTFLSILNYISSKCYLDNITFDDYMGGNRKCKKS